MRITKTNSHENTTLKMLVYGEPGAGKTSLAKTITEPTLIISSEAGLLCLKDVTPAIDVIDITVDDNGKSIPKEKRILRLLEVYKYLVTEECQEKYKWIFIDSLSEISQNMIEALYIEFPERKDSLPMYGENAKRMRGLVKSFRDIPYYNIVFTALPAIEKDENNKRYTTVSMIGKIAQQLPGYLDEVFYLDTIEVEPEEGSTTPRVKRFFITQKSESLVAKDRSGKLNKFEPADIGYVYNKIHEKESKK